MSNTEPKIIGYGVIFRDAGGSSKVPFLCMDDVLKDTLEEALAEAYALRGEQLQGMFSVDEFGSFATVYDNSALIALVEQMENDNMTDGEKGDQRIIEEHNFHNDTTL